ncbi:MAG TPA: hypothetical protein VM618_02970 [Acidimicrobiia bacterium]|nr:hypothetical protein [Acidimicrobiia bacterium]
MALARLRTLAGLLVALGVAWIGSFILGEYPYTGWLPIVGGVLLGVSVVGAAAFVERGDPPPWAIVVAAGMAVWGEWRAAWIDAGGIGPLPWEAWAAMAAAAVGALARLIPPRRRDDETVDDEAVGGEAYDELDEVDAIEDARDEPDVEVRGEEPTR